jgi:Flp pilus assembly protein TadB
LPFGLAAVIASIDYEYMSKLWTPRVGQGLSIMERYMGPMMLTFGVLLELAGCFIIYKICDIDV